MVGVAEQTHHLFQSKTAQSTQRPEQESGSQYRIQYTVCTCTYTAHYLLGNISIIAVVLRPSMAIDWPLIRVELSDDKDLRFRPIFPDEMTHSPVKKACAVSKLHIVVYCTKTTPLGFSGKRVTDWPFAGRASTGPDLERTPDGDPCPSTLVSQMPAASKSR